MPSGAGTAVTTDASWRGLLGAAIGFGRPRCASFAAASRVLAIRQAHEDLAFDETVEDHAAFRFAQPEETMRLFERQLKPGHFDVLAIHPSHSRAETIGFRIHAFERRTLER
jgi:hypothetical protein